MYRSLLQTMAVALLLIAANSAQAVVVPTGLSVGDTYQLAFVTAGTSTANLGGGITAYNTFVQTQADLPLSLAAGATWNVIGSTLATNALDNALVSAPVYLLDGSTIIANDFTDMWDGDIDNLIDLDQFGNSVVNTLVHTGSNTSGFATTNALSTAGNVGVGSTGFVSNFWISAGADQGNISRPFFALSTVLTVVPEPMSVSLAASGALALLWRRRRR